MRQIYLLLTFLLISSLSFAQLAKDFTNQKYMLGAVPEVEGKVVFTQTISLEEESESLAFEKLQAWHEKRYSELPSRVLLSDQEKLQVASLGHVNMSFKKAALYVDEADMIYQIVSVIKDKKIETTITNIKFEYSEAGKTLLYRAEEMITDKIAVKKNGKELSRYYDKFRAHAIDAVEVIFKSLSDTFTEVSVEQKMPTRDVLTKRTPREMAGYKQVGVNKLPANLAKLLADKLVMVSAKGVSTLVESGDLETVEESSVLRVSTKTDVDADDVYTVSFFTEIYRDALNDRDLSSIKTPSGGTAFSEAWMIIECKKTKKKSPIYAAPSILGEIVNVWIK